MASTTYTHNSYLFFNNGSPMQFSLRPSDERTRLKPVIEHGGGRICSKASRDTIRLALPGSIVRSDDCISTKWIWDCVEADKRLPMENYKMRETEVSDISDFEMSEQSANPPSKKMKLGPKKPYARDEDLEIINYIFKQKLIHDMKKQAVWEYMAKIKVVPDRSWQSLKERFIKHILPNINNYSLSKTHLDYIAKGNKLVAVVDGRKYNSYKRLYTYAEDMNILDYVLNQPDYKNVGGNLFWQQMIAKKVSTRTWQSVREHFLKHILKFIKNYKVRGKKKKVLAKLLRHRGQIYELSSSDDDNYDDDCANSNSTEEKKAEKVVRIEDDEVDTELIETIEETEENVNTIEVREANEENLKSTENTSEKKKDTEMDESQEDLILQMESSEDEESEKTILDNDKICSNDNIESEEVSMDVVLLKYIPGADGIANLETCFLTNVKAKHNRRVLTDKEFNSILMKSAQPAGFELDLSKEDSSVDNASSLSIEDEKFCEERFVKAVSDAIQSFVEKPQKPLEKHSKNEELSNTLNRLKHVVEKNLSPVDLNVQILCSLLELDEAVVLHLLHSVNYDLKELLKQICK